MSTGRNIEHWPSLPRWAWALWLGALVGLGVASALGLGDGPVFAGTMILSLFAIVFYGLPQSLR